MTQEEKAKAYDEALKLARDYHEDKNCFEYLKGVLENIFPELKESEDERIRKALIRHIAKISTEIPVGALHRINGVDIPDILAWLEKQASKPKWTEEDSSMQLMLMRDIEQVSFISKEGKDERIMWLNKLDDRFHQNTNDIQKSRWTEEDESKVEDIIYFLNTAKTHYASTKAIDDCVEWLESLKRRML